MLRSLTELCAGNFFFNRSRAHFEIPLSRVYFAVLPSQRPPGGGGEGVVGFFWVGWEGSPSVFLTFLSENV